MFQNQKWRDFAIFDVLTGDFESGVLDPILFLNLVV